MAPAKRPSSAAPPSPARKRTKQATAQATPPRPGPLLDFFKSPRIKREEDARAAAKHAEMDQWLEGESDGAQETDEQLARRLQALEDNQLVEDEALAKKLAAGLSDDAADAPVTSQMAADEAFARSLEEYSPGPSGTSAAAEVQTSPLRSSPVKAEAKGSIAAPTAGLEDAEESPIYTLDLGNALFDPLNHKDIAAGWSVKSTPYALLSHTFTLVSATRSRLLIVDCLCNMLRMLIVYSPESLLPAVWLCTNAIAPPFENTELGLGESIIGKGIKAVSGVKSLKALYNKHGDAGDVAFEAKAKVRTILKPAPLTISGVYKSLREISSSKGTGSGEKKQKIVERLLLSARGEEVRFVTRTLVCHLRIGAVKTTMLIALARAFSLNKSSDSTATLTPNLMALAKDARQEIFKTSEQIVKQSFARRPNYNLLVPDLRVGGIEQLLSGPDISIGTPIKPMLGLITRDLNDMFTRLAGQAYTCEYKYDGQRAQIHCSESGQISIFSRHLERMTEKYPDLCSLVPDMKTDQVRSFVLEGEVVAWDKLVGMQNFQSLAARARKNVEAGTVKQQVCLFGFDLMFLNGESLLSKSLRERRDIFKMYFREVEDRFTFVKSIDCPENSEEDVLAFYKAATDNKCEGIMAKLLENEVPVEAAVEDKEPSKRSGRKKALLATYTPDQRLESWLKVKKDYDAGADSLDLIPIGAWHGSGRKANWWSPILLAVRDKETGMLQAVCKCISGFTDVFYKDLKVKYAEDAETTFQGDMPGDVDSPLHPDYWFVPQEVWEVRMADITLSPVYRAGIGLVSEERGLSIRFPRFMKRREDKSIEEASTGEELAYMFQQQEKRSDAPTKDDFDDD